MLHVPTLACIALELERPTEQATTDGHCMFCGTELRGRGVHYKRPKSFGDHSLLSDPLSGSACASCAGLQTRKALTSASASGVVSGHGFSRLLSTNERLRFFMTPPAAPFAVAIVNATQQHVWWHTPATHDANEILLRYGQRTLDISRIEAINLADVIRRYELEPGNPARAFYSFSRNLKMTHDGHMTAPFMRDQSPMAITIKRRASQLSFGTLWAANQLVIACRKYEATSCEIALEKLASTMEV